MTWIARLWSWAKELFRRGPIRLKTVRVEEPPEALPCSARAAAENKSSSVRSAVGPDGLLKPKAMEQSR